MMSRFTILIPVVLLLSASLLGGCKSPGNSTFQEKRDSVLQMRSDALAEFREHHPGIDRQVQEAKGYAVFSNFGLKVLLAGGGHGFGVARDNATQRDTFMRMGEASAGMEFGEKDFRVLFVFNTEKAMRDFVDEGWDIGGDAQAAKLMGEGTGIAQSASIGDIDIYQLTSTGASLQAAVGGTRYWKDKDLNTNL